ncbi:MAG: patatin, partial [Bryobacteraceae bacterium]
LQSGYLHEIMRLSPLLGDAVYAFGGYEVGKMFGNPFLPKVPQSATIAVVLKSVFGPVTVGVSAGDSDHRKWWFALGRIF